jgi:hypothetical protein
LRRAIQAVVEGKQQVGDLSTLEDYIALEGLKSAVAESKESKGLTYVCRMEFAKSC